MKPVLIVACATIIILNGVLAVSSFDGASPKLTLLGTVEGKSFFADYASLRDWFAARSYCANNGMKLASIRTWAQWNLLESAYNSSSFAGIHWTAARDSVTTSQFHWDDSNEPVENLFTWLLDSQGIRNCVYYNARPGTDQYLRQSDCMSKYYGVLCET